MITAENTLSVYYKCLYPKVYISYYGKLEILYDSVMLCVKQCFIITQWRQ